MKTSTEDQNEIKHQSNAIEKMEDPRFEIIKSYRNFIVRTYCIIRFMIINRRILNEVEQYLPSDGLILDLGCGFGLFSLFFALKEKARRMISLDINSSRIEMAQESGRVLNVKDRTNFFHCNVLDYPFDEGVDAIVTLDLLHHIPSSEVPGIISHCYQILKPGGAFIIKDVVTRPFWKMAFTWILDKLMDFRCVVNYYSENDMRNLLQEKNFTVRIHHSLDIMPYPHVIYVCKKND